MLVVTSSQVPQTPREAGGEGCTAWPGPREDDSRYRRIQTLERGSSSPLYPVLAGQIPAGAQASFPNGVCHPSEFLFVCLFSIWTFLLVEE